SRLQKIFEIYGEVRNARTLARTIVEQRKNGRIQTIADFKNRIESCIKGKPNRYLAQVFQALSIEVNDELGVLGSFLEQAKHCLKPNGRLAIITFHSLEDRLVKKMMKQGTLGDTLTDAFGRRIHENPFTMLKDVLPGEAELEHNNRSRS